MLLHNCLRWTGESSASIIRKYATLPGSPCAANLLFIFISPLYALSALAVSFSFILYVARARRFILKLSRCIGYTTAIPAAFICELLLWLLRVINRTSLSSLYYYYYYYYATIFMRCAIFFMISGGRKHHRQEGRDRQEVPRRGNYQPACSTISLISCSLDASLGGNIPRENSINLPFNVRALQSLMIMESRESGFSFDEQVSRESARLCARERKR